METLGNIGNFFSSGAGKGISSLAELGLTGAGLAGNMAANKNQQQLTSELNNPQLLAQKANSITQPLNGALTQAVNNQVGGTLAEQGLSQSPGIVATATSQALAPYEQQQQQLAMSTVMQGIIAALQGRAQPTNLAPLLALLGQQKPSTGDPMAGQGTSAVNMFNNVWGSQGDSAFSGLTPTDISSFTNTGTGQ